MEPASPHGEYIAANRRILTDIKSAANRLLDDPDRMILTVEPDFDVTFKAGALQAEDVRAVFEISGLYISPEDAEVIAEDKNRAKQAKVAIGAVALQSVASMHYIASLDQQEIEKRINHAPGPRVLAFRAGQADEVTILDNEAAVTINRLQLLNLEHYGSAYRYAISREDDMLKEYLSMALVSEQAVSVVMHNDLAEDSLHLRASMLMDDALQKVTPFFSGFYQTEEEIDNKLAELWQHYSGTAKEVEVSAILDEIRARAVGILESQKLQQEFDVSTPSTEKLLAWQHVLDSLI